jgi:hypothetical protein
MWFLDGGTWFEHSWLIGLYALVLFRVSTLPSPFRLIALKNCHAVGVWWPTTFWQAFLPLYYCL